MDCVSRLIQYSMTSRRFEHDFSLKKSEAQTYGDVIKYLDKISNTSFSEGTVLFYTHV